MLASYHSLDVAFTVDSLAYLPTILGCPGQEGFSLLQSVQGPGNSTLISTPLMINVQYCINLAKFGWIVVYIDKRLSLRMLDIGSQ